MPPANRLLFPYDTDLVYVDDPITKFPHPLRGKITHWWMDTLNKLANSIESVEVVDFGAIGDALRYDDGVSHVSTAFESATAVFTAQDIGKSIAAVGIGVAGATLVTTISSVTNSHAIVLTTAASAALTNVRFVYGTDNTDAFQSALDAITSGEQRTIVIPRAAGGYMTVGTLTIGTGKPSFQLGGATWYAAATLFDVTENTPAFPPLADGGCPSITGDGVQTSRIVYCIDTGNLIEQTQVNGSNHTGYMAEALALVNTATAFNFTTNYNLRLVNLQISGFYVGINLNGTNAVSGYGRGSWSYLANLFVNDFLSAGLMTSHAVEVMQVNVQYYAVINNPTFAWGMIIDTDTSGFSCKTVILSFCGMRVRNTLSSTAVWDRPPEFIFGDEIVVDSMPTVGMWFDSTLSADGLGRTGKSYHFVDCWSSFTTIDNNDGILIEAGEDYSFTDLRVRDCRRDGIRVTGGNYIRFVNIVCLGNNFQAAANGAGLAIYGATTGYVTVIGGLFGDNIAGEGSGFQYYGIFVDSTYTSPHAFQGMVYDGNATAPILDNSPASYNQHFGFTSARTVVGVPVAVLHKMYFPKGRLEIGDGNFYLDFKNDLANAASIVFGTNTSVRYTRTGHVLELISGLPTDGSEVQAVADLFRCEKIRSQNIAGFNVDPEAGYDAKTNVLKVVTQARMSFLGGATASPVKASTTGDLIRDKISVTNANDIDVSGLTDGQFVKRSGSVLASGALVPGSIDWSGLTSGEALTPSGAGITTISGVSTSGTLVTSVGYTTDTINIDYVDSVDFVTPGYTTANLTQTVVDSMTVTDVAVVFTNGIWTS